VALAAQSCPLPTRQMAAVRTVAESWPQTEVGYSNPTAATSRRLYRPAASPIIKVAALLSRYVAVGLLGAVGIALSAIGMIETASYALAVGGVLFCALAISADALTLVMPATIGALWPKRSPAMPLAGLLWCAGVAVTFINIAGYVGEHIEQYQTARESRATERNVTMERLAHLRNERKAIIELRPPAAILAAMAGARRPEQPALREALAVAKRRDAVDLELAAFERRLSEIPTVATADASAAGFSEIGGTAISDVELRRLRLALLLGLPLCGGLVLSLALALGAGFKSETSPDSRSCFRPRATTAALVHALESAGIDFINENGGGAGVRMKSSKKRSEQRPVSTYP
jgi:hypothetical protein